MTFSPTRGIHYPRGFQAVEPTERLDQVLAVDPAPSIDLISKMETWFYFRTLNQAEATVAFHPVIFQARWWNPGWYVTRTERCQGTRWVLLEPGNWDDSLTGKMKALVDDCYRVQQFVEDNQLPAVVEADLEILADQIRRDNS